jgi:hypothetical protein
MPVRWKTMRLCLDVGIEEYGIELDIIPINQDIELMAIQILLLGWC